jgi:release factor glutamine methyltransferase
LRPAQLVRRSAGYLGRHGVESPESTAEALLMLVLGVDRATLYTRAEGLSSGETRTFGRALCQRCTGTPLQHLTGDQAFRRITLTVRPGVFVPRPETEVLAGLALDELGDLEDPVVADVGTGTGAIALAIKDERPRATVFATDLSPEAVDLARSNASRLGLDVHVLEGDLLAPLPPELHGLVDLVVSNPPYVSDADVEDLPAEVRADPVMALVGGPEMYERLAAEALRWLRDDGALAVEIAAEDGDRVVETMRASFGGVRVEPDLAGRERVVVGRRP